MAWIGAGIWPGVLDNEWLEDGRHWIHKLKMKEAGVVTFCKARHRTDIRVACDAAPMNSGQVHVVFPRPLAPGSTPIMAFHLPRKDAAELGTLEVRQQFASNREYIGHVFRGGERVQEPLVLYWHVTGSHGDRPPVPGWPFTATTRENVVTPVEPWPEANALPPLVHDVRGRDVMVRNRNEYVWGRVQEFDLRGVHLTQASTPLGCSDSKVETVRNGRVKLVLWDGKFSLRDGETVLTRDDIFEF